jgi:HK97 family phage prohead protease
MSNAIIERRFLNAELRASMKGSTRTIAGYAATFGKSIRPEMQRQLGFNERCAPGCFQRSIRSGADITCLQNHDPSLLLGRVSNRTLQLREDNKGLYFECSLPDTSVARDLHALVTRGDIHSCSFSFSAGDNGAKWTKEKNDNGNLQATRTLTDVDLLDVSAVTEPAYLNTEVNARGEKDDDEDDLDAIEENSLQEVEHNSLVRAFFPNGIPVEVRSHMELRRRKSGIVSVRERMKMRLELSSRL